MRTSKPLSTISYNTKDFLISKLDQLIIKRKIEFYAFIEHRAETNEKKNHIHLFIIPNGLLNTDIFKDYLLEVVVIKRDIKPLGIMPIRTSKFGDWYLYGLHDRAYLQSKMLVKLYHYTDKDIICSEPDYLQELIQLSDFTKYKKQSLIADKYLQGFTTTELVKQGAIPISQINQYSVFEKNLKSMSQTYIKENEQEQENVLADKVVPF